MVVLDDLVIARVRLEPERESIANHGNDADDLVRQNIEGHPREKNFRNAEPKRLNQGESGNERRAGVADSGNKTDERVEAEAEVCARNTNDFVHDEREPFEERLQALALPLFFGWEDFPIDFL